MLGGYHKDGRLSHAWAVVDGVILDTGNLFNSLYNKKPSVYVYYNIIANCKIGNYGQGRSTWQNNKR